MSRDTVDFPHPVRPTSATVSPGRRCSEKWLMIGMPSMYWKSTSRNSTSPSHATRSTAPGESTMSGAMSSTSSTRAADAAARCPSIMIIPIIMNGTWSITT